MGTGTGLRGYLGIGFQNDLTEHAATSCHFLPFVSESLVEDIPRIDSQELRHVPDEGYTKQGLRSVAGDIVLEVTPHNLAIAAYAAMGQVTTDSHADYFTHKLLMTNSSMVKGGGPIPAFTAFVGRDVGCGVAYFNCFATGLSLDIANGEIAKMTMSIIGAAAEGEDTMTPTFDDVASAHIPWNTCSLQLSGAALCEASQFTISIANQIEARPTICNSVYSSLFKRSGFRQVRMNGAIEIASLNHYEELRDNDEHNFILYMTNGITNEYVNLTIPRAVYEGAPFNVGGPGAVAASLALRAHPYANSGQLWMESRTIARYEIGSGNLAP